jgi:hypothetical protein
VRKPRRRADRTEELGYLIIPGKLHGKDIVQVIGPLKRR